MQFFSTTILENEVCRTKTGINLNAFGMEMPGRSFSSNSYMFGFNGKEKDDEWNGTSGGAYDYGFRIYDPRIAKFLSVDPLTKKYVELTPYQFASNSPIWAIDIDGLEEWIVVKELSSNDPTKVKISIMWVPSSMRRTDAPTGVDYYYGANRAVDGNPDSYSSNFIDNREKQITNRSTSYYINPGKYQGNLAYPIEKGVNPGNTLSIGGTPGKLANSNTGINGENLKNILGNYGSDGQITSWGWGLESIPTPVNAYFPTNNGTDITNLPEAQSAINSALDFLSRNPTATISLEGQASPTINNTDLTNMQLSKNRVDFVYDMIIKKSNEQGIDVSNRITKTYVGSSNATGNTGSDNTEDKKVIISVNSGL